MVNDTSVPVDVSLVTTDDYFIVSDEDTQSHISQKIEGNGELSIKIKFAPNVAEKRYFKRTGELTVGYLNHPNAVNTLFMKDITKLFA